MTAIRLDEHGFRIKQLASNNWSFFDGSDPWKGIQLVNFDTRKIEEGGVVLFQVRLRGRKRRKDDFFSDWATLFNVPLCYAPGIEIGDIEDKEVPFF